MAMARSFNIRSRRLLRLVALAAPFVLMLDAVSVAPVQAWKPYTHTIIGYRVWSDVTDDGMVTVTVGSTTHNYPVDGRIVSALRQWPSYYNAGVIGPDAFPDITYGQAVIHPVHTGEWLKYIYDSAWRAQNDTQYTPDEKAQILAFAYGFLVHGAGDMWGHTLVNGFAGAVFPSVTNMVTDLVNKGDPTRLLVGLRHIIAEGYVGNATPGWDSAEGDDVPDPTTPCSGGVNPSPPDALCTTATDTTREELSQVCDSAMMANPPAGTTCEVTAQFNQLVPDVSANSTLGIPLDVPTSFVYNTLIDPNAPTPLSSCGNGGTAPGCPNGPYLLSSQVPKIEDYSIQRGPALNYFLDLEAQLQVKSAAENDRVGNNCLVDIPHTDCHHDATFTKSISTVRGTGDFVIGRWECSKVCFPDPTISGPALVVRDYVDAWITDLQAGLVHWPEFSLAIARGLFDPQTRRDAENDTCKTTGPEDIFNILRDNCEKGVSLGDAVFFAADHLYTSGDPSWINRYLIPMVGFPDIVGNIRNLGSEIAGAIDDVFQFLGIFNPLSAIIADLHEYVISTVENYIKDSYGVDIPTFEEFFKHPTQWFCGSNGGKSLTLFNYTVTPSGVFSSADHERMDGYMGFTDQTHHAPSGGVPTECTALNDTSKFDEAKFAAFADSVTMSKLLMLDGKQLNNVVGDALVDAGVIQHASAVSTYFSGVNYDSSTNNGTFPANVMVDTLGANGSATSGAADLWLQLIDGDHAWRVDGLPRFCNTTVAGTCSVPLPGDMQGYSLSPIPRLTNADPNDMTNAGGNGHFPLWSSCLLRPGFRLLFKDWENADNATVRNFPDLGDQPAPDASVTSAANSTVTFSGTSFMAGGTTYIAADNLFTLGASDAVFEPAYLAIQYRAYRDGTTPTDYLPPKAPFATLGSTFNISPTAGDGLWVVNSRASNPCKAFTAATPTLARYFLDTTAPNINISQPAATTYTHSQTLTLAYTVDDGSGSGVKSFTPALDGSTTLSGHGLQSGQAINLLTELSLGPHTFTIAATDNVNNSDSKTVTFTIIVTAQSIEDDVSQFLAAGMIRNPGLARSLLAKLAAAAARRAAGACATAANIYQAFIHELVAQFGLGIDPAAAAVMIGDAQYLIANCP